LSDTDDSVDGDKLFGAPADCLVPVPLAPASVLGVFNLRGTPVALVDLAAVLELPGHDEELREEGKAVSALVIRQKGIVGAALIDRMEVVLAGGRELFANAEDRGDNPVVRGFVEVEDRPGMVVTVLDSAQVLQRLKRLKYG
jgi:chemotaxis signal transduction protein